MIRGIAFDLEGTVIDIEWAHHQAHIAAAAEVGVRLDPDSALKQLAHFIGGPDDAVAAEIFDLSEKKIGVRCILERKRFHYNSLVGRITTIRPRDGFMNVHHWLSENGFYMSIGSVTPRSQALPLLRRSGLEEIFDDNCILLREDVSTPKPAPDVYLETARRMNISPSEQLVFEDSANGIRAARTAGSIGIGIPAIHRHEVYCALSEAGARCVFLNWDEINISGLIDNVNRECRL